MPKLPQVQELQRAGSDFMREVQSELPDRRRYAPEAAQIFHHPQFPVRSVARPLGLGLDDKSGPAGGRRALLGGGRRMAAPDQSAMQFTREARAGNRRPRD